MRIPIKISEHILVTPVFSQNTDVIALFEAGFIGPWGSGIPRIWQRTMRAVAQ